MVRRGVTTIVLLAAAALCLFSRPAYAYRIGDVDLNVAGSVFEEYDDNVTYASNDPLQDYITTLRLGATARYEGKLQTFSLAGNLSQQFFAKNHKFNNLAEDLTGTYSRELGKYDRFTISDSFVHAQEPTSFEDQFGMTTGRYSYYRNRADFSYTRDLTRQLSLRGNYNNESITYSRKDLAESIQHRIGADALYALSSADTALLGYEHLDKKYRHGARFKTDRVTTGLKHYFTSQLSFDGRVGQDFIKSSSDKKVSRQLYLSAALTDEIDAATRATLSYTKEGGATSSTQALRKSWQVAMGLSRQFMDRLAASISAFYGKGKYESLSIKDTFKGASASLGYDLTRKWKAGVSYSFSDLSSNVSTRDYVVNRVMLSMRYEF